MIQSGGGGGGDKGGGEIRGGEGAKENIFYFHVNRCPKHING